ncbi:FAD-dependent monooxygenase [Subtercola lobariae]|uniref:FAD-dependent oxidoreductase n=1 Tax=Subtercola lobariae TaxID=1588641 RepID=A0A917B0S6_9MICO|nr:NAD(P)/FAD-dependent oxidoreductase [Subtercola lobariae]GGF13124.1 FAD-dependent oxidoreductase [Subtercola lobariae]
MKALIIGGGVAGMSTALALHKAGIECEVFEARGSHSDGVGAFLTLAVNGIATLRMLGLDIARVPGIDTPRMQLMVSDAKPLTEFPLGPGVATVEGSTIGAASRGASGSVTSTGAGGSAGGAGVGAEAVIAGAASSTTTRTVKRAELYGALRARAEELGIRISYSKRIVAADSTPEGGVEARFDDRSTARGDLLIGADGLHSSVRGIIDAHAVKPRYLGLLNAGGYVHPRALSAGAAARDGDAARIGGTDAGPRAQSAAAVRWGDEGVMHMMFGTQMFFSWFSDGEGGVWWFANPAMKREPARGELAAISAGEWRERLLRLVEGDAGPAATIIRSSDELFAPWPTHDFAKVKVWSRARMIIVGDAAHAAAPSSGQGASMAIEDAAVLALALRDSGSIEQAFAQYEAVRRPRVSRIVRQGKRNGSGKTPGRFGRALRDAFLRRMLARPPRERDQSWLYEYPLDWERGL